MSKKSKCCSKLKQWLHRWSPSILACATAVLAICAIVYGADIKKGFQYYSSERTMSILRDEYKYDRNRAELIMFYAISVERPILLEDYHNLVKDLDNISKELEDAENQLSSHSRIPIENKEKVENALDKFDSDYIDIIEKSSQNRDAE